jgi:hypothetical protein
MYSIKKILKYKAVEEKIDEALALSKETGNEFGFNICMSGNKIITTKIEAGYRDVISINNKCPGTKIGSFHVHPGSKVARPSQKDIHNLRYGFVCIGVNSKNADGKIVKCYDSRDFQGN